MLWIDYTPRSLDGILDGNERTSGWREKSTKLCRCLHNQNESATHRMTLRALGSILIRFRARVIFYRFYELSF